ncbi:MAG: ParA family protein [Actinomycetota bacterium]
MSRPKREAVRSCCGVEVAMSSWPVPAETRVLAVANQKGGVGKTTTAVSLGAWLAIEGARVLLVDLDPQANATTGLGIDPRGPRPPGESIYHALLDGSSIFPCIRSTQLQNLRCVASSVDLAGAEVELVALTSRELRLRRALEAVMVEFDYLLIDCPPSLGLLTVNALAAAREVVVPIQCEYYALEGLGQLLTNLALVRASLNPALRLAGIVLTMYDQRTRLSGEVADQVRAHFPDRVYRTIIPRSVRLSEAPSFGRPIPLYDPGCRGSQAYRGLAWELVWEGRPPAAGPPMEQITGEQITGEQITGEQITGEQITGEQITGELAEEGGRR